MRKLFTSVLFVAIASLGFSQYYYVPNDNAGGNPGNVNKEDSEYPANGGGLPTSWSVVVSGPTSTWTSAQTIPFNFQFMGNAVTEYAIHPSGVVSFITDPLVLGAYAPSSTPSALPNATIPDSSLCYWGLSIGTGDFIVKKTFGTAPNRQHWIMFNSAVSAGTQTGWVYGSIVLEEGSNKIYFVNQRIQCVSGQSQCAGRPALSVGIQVDGSTAYQQPQSPNYSGGSTGNDPSRVDNGYSEFVPGTQPTNSVVMIDVGSDKYLKLNNAPYTISGNMRNLGSALLSSYDLVYQINNDAPVVDNVTGKAIGTFSNDTYSHSTTWNPTAAGDYTIKVWVANPNGGSDPDMSDDTVSTSVTVVDTFIQRKPLYEVFTSSTCGPCRPGNENFHNVVAGKDDEYVAVKYQQNFPGSGDPYATNETVNRRNAYGVNSIPRMELDGGWDQNASSFTAALHNQYRDVPSFLNIRSTYDVDTTGAKVVTINTEIDVVADIDPALYRLFTVIIEGTTFENVKSNGESEFIDVVKKMLPNEQGEIITDPMTAGATITKSTSHTFPGSFRLPADGQTANRINHATEHSVEGFTDLKVAVWVQRTGTDEVLQATWAENLSDYTSTKEVEAADMSVTVYPNPARDFVQVAYNLDNNQEIEISLINSMGAVIEHSATSASMGGNAATIDTEGLSNGVYFINVKSGEENVTKKFMIAR